MDDNQHQRFAKMESRFIWVACSAHVAVLWQAKSGTSGGMAYAPIGQVAWGEIESGPVVPLRTLVPPTPDSGVCIVSRSKLWKGWEVIEAFASPNSPPADTLIPRAPSFADIRQAWEAHTPPPAPEVDASPRRADEGKYDFLARIAVAYRQYAATTGKPTLEIAKAAGVSKTTAGRWISDARLSGLLPETTRGRTTGSGLL